MTSAKKPPDCAAPVVTPRGAAVIVLQAEKLGELRSAREAGLLAGVTPPELGEVVSGSGPGRRSQDDITICDLTGTGAQDTAIATFALKAARAAAAGTLIKA